MPHNRIIRGIRHEDTNVPISGLIPESPLRGLKTPCKKFPTSLVLHSLPSPLEDPAERILLRSVKIDPSPFRSSYCSRFQSYATRWVGPIVPPNRTDKLQTTRYSKYSQLSSTSNGPCPEGNGDNTPRGGLVFGESPSVYKPTLTETRLRLLPSLTFIHLRREEFLSPAFLLPLSPISRYTTRTLAMVLASALFLRPNCFRIAGTLKLQHRAIQAQTLKTRPLLILDWKTILWIFWVCLLKSYLN